MAIGVALIGSGIFVKEEHLPAVQSNSHLELKAIYSRSLKSAKSVSEGLSGIDLYSEDSAKSYADLLSRDDVKGFIIALPILVQPEFIKRALGAGKHVFAEKPVAKDVAAAEELISWYHENIDTSKVFLGIAEQYRYLKSFLYGAEEVKRLGRVLGCSVRLHTFIRPGSKYFETPWRKKPEHQGGFLLDGGVHFIAAIRLMLGHAARVKRISAYTQQLQEHLPPVDSVDATFKLANGSTGSFSVSFGTTFTGAEWAVACEGGSVIVQGSQVTTKPKDGEDQVKEFEDDGVRQEVDAWADSIVKGKAEERQSAEEALADLEMLETMLRSGEKDGEGIDMRLQI